MAKQTIPNADAVETEELGFFDQLHNFELGPPPSDHETTSDDGEAGTDKDQTGDAVDDNQVDTNNTDGPDTTGDEGDNVDEERGNNPPSGNQTDDEYQLPEGGDDRVAAIMGLMQSEQLLASDVDIEPTLENVPKLMDHVALHLFEGYVQSMPPLARDLVSYLSQSAEFNVDQARQFFDQYLAPSVEFSVPQDEEQAMSYLQNRLAKEKLFPSNDAMQTYLDDLLEKGKLMEIAVPKAEEEKAIIDSQRQAEIQRIEQEKANKLESTKKYYQNIFTTIDEQQWRDDRKAKVRQAVDPKQVQQINTKVRKSPLAVSQLALLYSFFDEESQSFDLSAFAQASAGQEVKKKKENLKNKSVEAALNRVNRRGVNPSDDADKTGFWKQMRPAE